MGVSIRVCICLVCFVSRTQATRSLDRKNGCGFANDSIGRCNFFLYVLVSSSNTFIAFREKKGGKNVRYVVFLLRTFKDVYIYFRLFCLFLMEKNWNS